MPPSLSVVIATFNRKDLLGNLLGCLAAQDAPAGSFEVIAVDNASSDGTWEWLSAQRREGLTALREEKPGAAAARNVGLRAARGERVLFLDDDMEPAPDCVRRHQEAHAREGGASCLGRIIFPWDDHPEPLLRYLARAQVPSLFPFEDGAPAPFQHYFTAHVSSPRAALLDLGGFDESFGTYGYEDTEMGYRLQRAGVPLRFLASARAVHRDCPSPEAYWAKARQAGRCKAHMIDRHPELRRVFRRARLNAWLGPALDAVHATAGRLGTRLAAGLRGRPDLPPWARWTFALERRYWQSRGWRDYQSGDTLLTSRTKP